ncbi:DUF2249 domain-containing protein [Bradyrhizobium sp. WSM2793]|uniref:DUF2249 domain-containing protein n=1 Tax=Bradyrhizobium sp. WSM2793 TaxID=1038866 RepID=UPI000365EFA1|nr:DUF2249 domain-containing protein [Bradyrhizobium sp. WSM2793]
MTEFIDIDVRPILRAGGEPFSIIMAALARLAPGEGLRLYAPFKPVPLFDVMASKGFAHREAELEGGEWEIRFMPDDGLPDAAEPARAELSGGDWPEPVVHLDNRDLDPPEPMVLILVAVERLAPGQTLGALLSREPVFLFRELTKRGHQWRGGFTPQKDSYQLTVRVRA